MSNPLSTIQFTNTANSIFNNKFNYNKVYYKNANTKVIIICPQHGEFSMTPVKHLHSKHGCKKCGTDSMAQIQKEITHSKFNEFIKTSKYNYSKSIFNSITDKILIICPNHGEFNTTVDHHLRGTGCKKCADQNKTGGYNEVWFNFDISRKQLPGILYVLEMYSDSERFIKIGITKNTVEQRYRGSKYNYTILKLYYGPLYDCYTKETFIKNYFHHCLYLTANKTYTTESFNLESKDNILCSPIFNNAI